MERSVRGGGNIGTLATTVPCQELPTSTTNSNPLSLNKVLWLRVNQDNQRETHKVSRTVNLYIMRRVSKAQLARRSCSPMSRIIFAAPDLAQPPNSKQNETTALIREHVVQHIK